MPVPVVLLASLLAWAPPEAEVEPEEPDEEAEGGLRIVGFADLAYIQNFNFPANHVYRNHPTTPRTNEFALNLAGVWLIHDPTDRLPFWVRVGLHAGASADANYAAEPTPGGEDSQFAGAEVFKHISVANTGVEFDSGTDLGAGLFGSPIGIGSMFVWDNWLYTKAWELNWVPYYLMGARLGQNLPAGFRIEAWVVNGFQTIGDANQAPSYMAALYWTRGDVSVGQHVYFGPEQAQLDPRGWLVHSNTQVVWNTDRIGVAALWDVGQEQPLDEPDAETAIWTGGQASLRVAALRRDKLRLDVVARPELWWDRNGRTHGNDGFLVSGTAGLGLYGFSDAVQLRLEYRYDWTSDPNGYFYSGTATNPASTGLASQQHNLIVGVVGVLDRRLPTRPR